MCEYNKEEEEAESVVNHADHVLVGNSLCALSSDALPGALCSHKPPTDTDTVFFFFFFFFLLLFDAAERI